MAQVKAELTFQSEEDYEDFVNKLLEDEEETGEDAPQVRKLS
jgi:hypothetical protein